MSSYSDFAYIYDFLMHKDINYGHIADYIENIFSEYGISPELVCDLACGTGNVTIPMSQRGYNMTGVDFSYDMLNVARKKSNHNEDILWLNQNMQDIDLYGTMGAFLCMVDGINYVISKKALFNMFSKIKRCFIDEGGIFIFDISTRYKLKHIIADNTFVHSDKNVFYTWQNKYIEDKNLSDMLLNFFVKSKHGYKRFEERHLQRAYSVNELLDIIKKAGWSSVSVYDGYTFDPPRDDSERVTFVCKN